jgi:hypothetical protein
LAIFREAIQIIKKIKHPVILVAEPIPDISDDDEMII